MVLRIAMDFEVYFQFDSLDNRVLRTLPEGRFGRYS